jgi:hypothetical protein
MIQIRMAASTGRAYYDKKIAEGKTPRYATPALKRHLAGHLWRTMLADQTRTARTPSERRGKRLLTNREAPHVRRRCEGTAMTTCLICATVSVAAVALEAVVFSVAIELLDGRTEIFP